MPRINLLPHRQRERAQKRRDFGAAAIAAALVAALFAGVTSIGFSAAIDHQKDRNDVLTKEIGELEKQIADIDSLDAQKQRTLARMGIIERLQRSRPEVVHVFDQLARALPDGVYLTAVKQTDRKLELKGVAQSSTRVSTFMKNIEASQWLAEPQLQVIETLKGTKPGAEFTIFATQRSLTPEDDAKSAKKPVRTASLSPSNGAPQ
jgi:type IV pilus assembly protein PilN